jgi:hypothetical protein
MRGILLLAALLTTGPIAGAEVIRCTDTSGRVSYTDGACPAGARKVANVSTQPPISVVRDAGSPATNPDLDAGRADAAPRESRDVPAPPQAPGGPIIIDGRRDGNAGSALPSDSRWSDRGVDTLTIDDGALWIPGVSHPQRPRDMRPRIRSCDDRTCQDTQGNHFTRSGQLDRYRSIDGRTCRPVGTTTVCR